MITARQFIDEAGRHGFDFYTGVPCSFLAPLINGVLNDRTLRYVGATSEGEAVAIAAGAWLAGRRTVVMCQNSGLGNAINPLTSLNAPFRIPTLLISTWRGQPGIPDEPQHAVMGVITDDLLRLIGVDSARFPTTAEILPSTLAAAAAAMRERSLPYALVMEKDSVAPEALLPQTHTEDQGNRAAPSALHTMLERFVVATEADMAASTDMSIRPTRLQALERFLAATDDDTAVIATTGKCGRELYTLADRRQHLYQVGSMGGASAMGLGVALNTTRPVVVLDGDGAALMKLGNLATIGATRPANLIHIILDNGVYDSTGGQATVAETVDFAAVAMACGYPYTASCLSLADFDTALREAATHAKPAMIHLRIAPGSLAKLGRPTVPPEDVARRFKTFLGETR
jgi:phosphonopyruvate decarboxylase